MPTEFTYEFKARTEQLENRFQALKAQAEQVQAAFEKLGRSTQGLDFTDFLKNVPVEQTFGIKIGIGSHEWPPLHPTIVSIPIAIAIPTPVSEKDILIQPSF